MNTILAYILLGTLAFTANSSAADPTWVSEYDALLDRYATPTGVRYADWHASQSDRTRLAELVTQIGAQKLNDLGKEEQLAFYLNAYNALILDAILAEYPTKGPGGGGLFGRNRFFKKEHLLVAGEAFSFSTLENDKIRPDFNEPRIHFALNCASASCPPLHIRAFRGETLDATLTELTKGFVDGNPLGVSASGNNVAISKIFDWYADDFSAAGGALSFINRYRVTKLPADSKVTHQDYDWTLNAAR